MPAIRTERATTVDIAFSSTDTKSERFRFSVESPSATDGRTLKFSKMELRQKISFGLSYGAPQRNEPVLEAANFTFLRGWAKIAMLRYDPRDAAEVRVFYNDRFLCRAICPELAGAVITLRDVLKARKQRRRGLFAKLRERSKAIDQLLEIKRNDSAESDEHPATEQIEKKARGPRLKRYRNE